MKKDNNKKPNKILKEKKKSKTKNNKKSKKYSIYKKIVGGMNFGGFESNSDKNNNNKNKAKRLNIQIIGDLNIEMNVLSTDQIYECIQKEVDYGTKIRVFFGEEPVIRGDTFDNHGMEDWARLIVQLENYTFNSIVEELIELNPWVDETKLRDSSYFPVNLKMNRRDNGILHHVGSRIVREIQTHPYENLDLPLDLEKQKEHYSLSHDGHLRESSAFTSENLQTGPAWALRIDEADPLRLKNSWNLGNLSLKKLPSSIGLLKFDFPFGLDLSDNKLESLPQEICNITCANINLMRNPLYSIPSCWKGGYKLHPNIYRPIYRVNDPMLRIYRSEPRGMQIGAVRTLSIYGVETNVYLSDILFNSIDEIEHPFWVGTPEWRLTRILSRAREGSDWGVWIPLQKGETEEDRKLEAILFQYYLMRKGLMKELWKFQSHLEGRFEDYLMSSVRDMRQQVKEILGSEEEEILWINEKEERKQRLENYEKNKWGMSNKFLENFSKEIKEDWIDLLPPVLSVQPVVPSKPRNRPPAHFSNNEEGFYPSNTNSNTNTNSNANSNE